MQQWRPWAEYRPASAQRATSAPPTTKWAARRLAMRRNEARPPPGNRAVGAEADDPRPKETSLLRETALEVPVSALAWQPTAREWVSAPGEHPTSRAPASSPEQADAEALVSGLAWRPTAGTIVVPPKQPGQRARSERRPSFPRAPRKRPSSHSRAPAFDRPRALRAGPGGTPRRGEAREGCFASAVRSSRFR